MNESGYRLKVVQLASALAVLVCVVVSPLVASAQDSGSGAESDVAASKTTESDDETSQSGDFFDKQHRREMYEKSKLSTGKALLYNLAFPGLGNVYAEQYFLGGLAFSLMAFTIMFVTYGLTTQQPQFLYIGLGTASVAYSGSMISSYFGVQRYNRRLREGYKLGMTQRTTPFDLPRARTVGVTIKF